MHIHVHVCTCICIHEIDYIYHGKGSHNNCGDKFYQRVYLHADNGSGFVIRLASMFIFMQINTLIKLVKELMYRFSYS